MEKLCLSRIKKFYKSYLNSNIEYLYQAYGRCSGEKHKAYEHCRELFKECNGKNFKIVSVSCWIFTVGFIGIVDGIESFIYITKSGDYYIELSKLKGE